MLNKENTVALRLRDIVTSRSTIYTEHQETIDNLGYVWLGKTGSAVSAKTKKRILSMNVPRILLYDIEGHCYWAYISAIEKECPEPEFVLEYYKDINSTIKSWFKIHMITPANTETLSKCQITSLQNWLSEKYKSSSCSFYLIDYFDEYSFDDDKPYILQELYDEVYAKLRANDYNWDKLTIYEYLYIYSHPFLF